MTKKGNKTILFLSPYPLDKAPSQRLKYEQYYEHLRSKGYTITTSSFVDQRFWEIIYQPGKFFRKALFTLIGYRTRLNDLFRIRQFDVVYCHLWVVPFGPPIFEWMVAKLSKRLIYDIDDLIYLKPKSAVNGMMSLLKSSGNSIYLMKQANHVITCTPHLDQFVRRYNQKTTDISSTINTDLYIPRTSYEFLEAKPIIGWSGSLSTSKYLYLLKDVLLDIKKIMDFKLLVMGDDSFHIDGLDIEAIPWKEEYEVSTIRRFDVGVYPLPNEEWVLGKSGLKALQYMALGVPTVATAVGANFRVIENGKSGYLVGNNLEWKNSILDLMDEVTLRSKIGVNAIQRVESLYSIKSNAGSYLTIISGS